MLTGGKPMKKNVCIVAGIAGILLGAASSGAHAEGRMRYHGRESGPYWGWRSSYWEWGDPYWGWRGPYWRWNGGYLVIDTRPSFIVLPGYGFSVSVGTPYDMIYYDNHFYAYNNNYWYYSPAYNGPWVVIHENDLPDIIRKHSFDDIRKTRDIESSKNANQGNKGHHGDENSSNNQSDMHRDARSTDSDQTR